MFLNKELTKNREQGVKERSEIGVGEVHRWEWLRAQQFFKRAQEPQRKLLYRELDCSLIDQFNQQNIPRKLKIGSAYFAHRLHSWLKSVSLSYQHICHQNFVVSPYQLDVKIQGEQCRRMVQSQQKLLKRVQKWEKSVKSGYSEITQQIGVYQRCLMQVTNQVEERLKNVREKILKEQEAAARIQNFQQQLCRLQFQLNVINGLTTLPSKQKLKRRIQDSCRVCLSKNQSAQNRLSVCSTCGIKFHQCCFRSSSQKYRCRSCDSRDGKFQCHICGVTQLPTSFFQINLKLIKFHPLCLLASYNFSFRKGILVPISMPSVSFKVCTKCKGAVETTECRNCGKGWHLSCGVMSGVKTLLTHLDLMLQQTKYGTNKLKRK